jgi:hypothetical protein
VPTATATLHCVSFTPFDTRSERRLRLAEQKAKPNLMSAFELDTDHLAALVNIGSQLTITYVHDEHANVSHQLDLTSEHDRAYVLSELISQMRTSVAHRYTETAITVENVPTVRFTHIPLETITHIAQALQWARCYQYQSCEDPNWFNSFAYRYTNTLIESLISKFISTHSTTWTYDGPALT